ncbi:penicillin acylase family protein [Telmatobacter sp. DSM 110680]|uniref:Penicillin acylase family protein n=1 Tax=Telmatobacter sp. DSM 110680 TaxID=3036704 RepID=A0AAU7DIC7_9BACT
MSAAPTRRRHWLRIILFTAVWIVIIVVALSGLGILWLRSAAKSALPILDGDIHLASQGAPTLSAPVTVRRDQHGVPHIDAATQEDMFVAQGYVTAQDRLWQMDAFRRNANGELAEVMGPSLLRHDKAQRMFQFRNTAHRIYASLPPAERARYEAYARGVNLYITQHQDSLPPEFHLLHYKPEPWTGADSISIGMMMVDMLDTHWYTKLSREKIAAKLNNPKLESDLYPVGSWRDHPPTGELLDLSQPHPQPPGTSNDEDDERTVTRTMPVPDWPTPMGAPSMRGIFAHGWGSTNPPIDSCRDCTPGSNNWVIDGKHTASGKPLLSNDMHLGLNEPNIWYMADLRAPGYHTAGVTLPGMPFVIAGHNEHVAWGFTALYGDVQDLYIEKLDGKGNFQVADGSWKPLNVNHEIIRVRSRKDFAYDVRLTDHGPLLDPLFTRDSRAIALKWTLYDTTLNSIPLYGLNTASNWTEFSSALSQWCWPTQNVVYSDDQGHIGYHAVGRIPMRSAGITDKPVLDAVHGWQGYIPFDDMPNAFDPPSGFLATANSRVTPDKSKYPITDEWADPYRAERISKLLQGRDNLKPADMLATQTDIYSEMDQEFGHRLSYAIDHTANADDQLRKAADLMRSWDGRLTTDSAAASLVTQARYALRIMLLEPKLGAEDAENYEWSESNFAVEEIVMRSNPAWLPSAYKDWDAFLADAVRRGMIIGHATTNVSQWTYGSWHVVDIEHPLSNFLPYVGRIAGTGEQPLSGDTTTVKQVGRSFGPSQRFTMDWNNIDGSTENIVLGESGNPYSPYFRDQWDDYYNGRTFALPFTPTAVTSNTRHTLRLLP